MKKKLSTHDSKSCDLPRRQEAIEALSPLGNAADDLAVLAKFMAIRTR